LIRWTLKVVNIFRKDALEFLSDQPDNSVNLIISSPPYCIGKEYDTSRTIDDFIAIHENLRDELVRVLKRGGSICWQVGNHVRDNVIIPLDAVVYAIFSKSECLKLRNRIVWTFGHGAHCSRRFSGRHETVLWFTKGNRYAFQLDAVRVPQKYPGKRHHKGPKLGEPSGNPLGKNPGDVWEIPNVKANHVEKTDHPCQFPVALAQRLVKALCPRRGIVADPYLGSGSTAVAALLEGRRFIGCDIEAKYIKIAQARLEELRVGNLKIRPLDKPIHVPNANDSVAKIPSEWRQQGVVVGC
jgi:adenine-specific DNA-methyltransferase